MTQILRSLVRYSVGLVARHHQMYESFFHLQHLPFRMYPDASCIFMTHSHREAFASLLYAISARKGFVVLTGDAGTGKTSLLRALMRSAVDAKFSVILTPRVNTDEFLELVLLDFGVTDIPATKSQRIIKLRELLFELRRQGKVPVLGVDEAHTLSPETLEELRLLTNLETSEEKLLQIILAGQSDLATILNRQDLRQLKQRIELRMDLKALAPAEVGSYMEFRWLHAGGSGRLPFTPETIALIASASRGIPRVVNCICDNALLLAFAEADALIEIRHVSHVLRDLDLVVAEPKSGHRGLSRAFLETVDEVRELPTVSGVRQPAPETLEDDVPPAPKASIAFRWADEMNLGSIRARRSRS